MLAQTALRKLKVPAAGRLIAGTRIVHPFPLGLNVAVTVVFAVIAVEGLPSTSVLVRLAAAMFCIQAAIGASNDYFDRDLDARTKPTKVIVRGLVEPRTALLLASGFAVAAGVLAATLGTLAFIVGAVGFGAGLAYNLRLKRSVLSPLPFMVALPALPIWVWVSVDRFSSELWWLAPFAPLAGLAVHLANAAPDIEADFNAGIRGLAHVLGLRATLLVAWGSLGLAFGLSTALGPHLEYRWSVFLPGAGAAAVLLLAAVGAQTLRPGREALQFGFGAVSLATAVLSAAWLASV